jgi:hypothetical protein
MEETKYLLPILQSKLWALSSSPQSMHGNPTYISCACKAVDSCNAEIIFDSGSSETELPAPYSGWVVCLGGFWVTGNDGTGVGDLIGRGSGLERIHEGPP